MSIEDGQLQYNPSTNTLTVANITATLTGISTGSERVNIDRKSDNTNYQVAFTEPGTDEYQILYLDSFRKIHLQSKYKHFKCRKYYCTRYHGTLRYCN